MLLQAVCAGQRWAASKRSTPLVSCVRTALTPTKPVSHCRYLVGRLFLFNDILSATKTQLINHVDVLSVIVDDAAVVILARETGLGRHRGLREFTVS